jgi:hypothetical protein
MAMSKCDYFLHGLSAVSEAVFYWRQQDDPTTPVSFAERSVNLEFYQFYKRQKGRPSADGGGAGAGAESADAPMSIGMFRQMLHKTGVK